MVRTEEDKDLLKLLSQQRWEEALALTLRRYEPELSSFLIGVHRDYDEAADAYALLTEDLWRGLPSYRAQGRFSAWVYTLARHASAKVLQRRQRRQQVPLSQSPEALAATAPEQTSTASFLRSSAQELIESLRDRLTPEERTLLILRVDRQLSWQETAIAMTPPGHPVPSARAIAALRKKYERTKDKLQRWAGVARARKSA